MKFWSVPVWNPAPEASTSLNKTKLREKHVGGRKERRDRTSWLVVSPPKWSVAHNGTGAEGTWKEE